MRFLIQRFQVEFPVDVTPIDSRSIGSIKADANEQAEKWEYEKWGFQNMVWMYDAFSKFEALEDPLEGFLWIVKDIGVQGSYPEPQAAALSHLENLAKHFKGIAADPPDTNFKQITEMANRGTRLFFLGTLL